MEVDKDVMIILSIMTPEDVAKMDVMSEEQKRLSLTSEICLNLSINYETITKLKSFDKTKEEEEAEKEKTEEEIEDRPAIEGENIYNAKLDINELQDSGADTKLIEQSDKKNNVVEVSHNNEEEEVEVFEEGDVRNLLNVQGQKKKKKSEGSIDSVYFFLEQKNSSQKANKEMELKEINEMYKKNNDVESFDIEEDDDDDKKKLLKGKKGKKGKKIVTKSGVLFNKKQS